MPRRITDEPGEALLAYTENAARVAGHAREETYLAVELDAEARARLVTVVDAAIRDLRAVRRALTGELRTCEACGVKFLGRADARFHSATCRQRAHRAGDA